MPCRYMYSTGGTKGPLSENIPDCPQQTELVGTEQLLRLLKVHIKTQILNT